MTALERVDKLVEECVTEVGQPPSTVVVKFDTWEWFAAIATAGTDPRIRWEKTGLMYGGIRIKWVR